MNLLNKQRRIMVMAVILQISALIISAGCIGDTASDNRSVFIPEIEILEDENSSFAFDDIAAGRYSFSKVSERGRNLGFTDSTWWIRVSPGNRGLPDDDYVLLYNQSWTDTVVAYILSDRGYDVYNAGRENGFRARPIRERNYAFPVKVKNGVNGIFLKLKSSNRIVLDLKFMTREAFRDMHSVVEPFYAILLAFLLYNFILFFFIRGREYLYYCGFLLTFLIFLLAFDGTGFMYFWGDSPAWDDIALTGMLILQSMWVILFFIKFTGAAEIIPRAVKFLRILAILTIPAALLKILFPSHNVILWTLPLLQLIAVTLISLSLYLAIKGSRSAAYFFCSFIVLLGFSLANSLMSFALFSESFIVHMGMHIGATFCAVTFSLGMADSINLMRISLESSENSQRIQNLKLEKANEELDATNQELHAAMEELEATNEELQAIMEELQSSNRLLWESEQRLSGIVNNAPVGITIADLQGRILQANDYTLRMLGYSKEELLGKSFIEISNPEDISRGAELFSMLVQGKIDSYRLDKRYLCKDGSDWWADISAAPIKSETGEITAVLGITIDINEKMEANRENERIQNQLWQAQKLEAVGTLAGGIAHDFNNILTAIMGYTELTIAEIQEGTCSEENLQQVLNSSRRARDIVRQILTLSRKGDNIKVPQNIIPIVEETIKLLRATIPSTISISMTDNSEKSVVVCDSTQLQQVLLNLCTNANHAMRDTGGTLAVSIRNRVIDEHEASLKRINPGEFICISVADTGTGMNRDVMDRIFDPFFTTKAPGLGTGLGLSVARGIMIDHDGFITAVSEEGKGSTFIICLPVSRDTEVDTRGKSEQDYLPGGSERLLIVDDEHLIAEMTKLILQKLGYSVKTAPGSLEALEIFRKDPGEFDLVITDQTMPHMTGIDLAKEMKRIKPGIPVILCTGYSETADPEKALESGINEFLYKPVLTEDLADAIRKVLDGDSNRKS